MLYPLANIIKKARWMSDHNPIIYSSGQKFQHKRKPFRFQLVWLKQKEFKDKVAEIWSKLVTAKSNLDVWLIKEKKLKSYLKGWGDKKKGDERKLKMELNEELLNLEILEEDNMLNREQLQRKTEIQKQLMVIF